MRPSNFRSWNRSLRSVVLYGLLVAVVAVPLFPFLWIVSTSLRSQAEIASSAITLLPRNVTLENYVHVWRGTPLPRFLVNSLLIGVFVACSATVLSSLAGYALSRFAFLGRRLFMSWLLYTKMFPWVVIIIPVFILMTRLGLVNTHLSLIMMYTIGAIPFATWMCKTYFDSVPREIEEAALVDGCTRIESLTRVVLPLAAPGMAAVWVYSLVIALQEFLLALILLKDERLFTLPLGIFRFIGMYGDVMWGPLMASAVIATAPLVAAFAYLQEHVVRGLTAGAIRG